MTAGPTAVIGMPAYNNVGLVAEALESLLAQTRRDFALVIVDDCSTDGTPAVVERYMAIDDRIIFRQNCERLGMIRNWRATYELARELFPESPYFAWASDHDVWHPRWLESLVEHLDANPEVVLAYPLTLRDYGGGQSRPNYPFDTFGVKGVKKRFIRASLHGTAGNMVYGLFRSEILAPVGVFRSVILPDRLLLVELSIRGQFKQVPELLWYRRVPRQFSFARQRAAFFPEGSPWYSYLPPSLVHGAILFRELCIRARGRPMVGRAAGLALVAVFLAQNCRRQLHRLWRLVERTLRLRPVFRVGPRLLRRGFKRARSCVLYFARAVRHRAGWLHRLIWSRGNPAPMCEGEAVSDPSPAPSGRLPGSP